MSDVKWCENLTLWVVVSCQVIMTSVSIPTSNQHRTKLGQLNVYFPVSQKTAGRFLKKWTSYGLEWRRGFVLPNIQNISNNVFQILKRDRKIRISDFFKNLPKTKVKFKSYLLNISCSVMFGDVQCQFWTFTSPLGDCTVDSIGVSEAKWHGDTQYIILPTRFNFFTSWEKFHKPHDIRL